MVNKTRNTVRIDLYIPASKYVATISITVDEKDSGCLVELEVDL